jgi:nucleotide-binding universal stress UspA family protein
MRVVSGDDPYYRFLLAAGNYSRSMLFMSVRYAIRSGTCSTWLKRKTRRLSRENRPDAGGADCELFKDPRRARRFPRSDAAAQAALALAFAESGCELISCHAYAAKLHFDRFEAMEKGLPDKYQEETQLDHLRKTHDDLIENGLELISDSYTRDIGRRAGELGIKHIAMLPEGKNYVKILESVERGKADLVILGSSGLGETPDCLLGSVAERVLLHSNNSDIMLMKGRWDVRNKPIIVGVDGSNESYHALNKALDLSGKLGCEVIAVAVYDPFFHSTVFRKIADVLPPKDQEKFNFTAQEKLHDEIIDDGLEKVYRDGLDRAVLFARERGIEIKTDMLEGKVYTQICHYAALKNAGLIVLGRHGLHREKPALIGSNTNQICRLSMINVLVTVPSAEKLVIPYLQNAREPLEWTQEAARALEHIPEFVRTRAQWTIEEYARTHGYGRVTEEVVTAVRSTLGMGRQEPPDVGGQPGADTSDENAPDARRVVFRNEKKRAPAFHRMMAESKVRGAIVKTGDRIMNYIIVSTEPQGPVRVTADTKLDYEK